MSRALLPSLHGFDFITSLGVLGLLALVGVVSAIAPLRRVAALDPVSALRNE